MIIPFNIVKSGIKTDIQGIFNRLSLVKIKKGEMLLLAFVPAIFLLSYILLCNYFFNQCINFADAALPLTTKISSLALNIAWPLIMLSSSIVSISAIIAPHTRLIMLSPEKDKAFWLLFARTVIRSGLITGFLAATALYSMIFTFSLPIYSFFLVFVNLVPYTVTACLLGFIFALYLGKRFNVRKTQQTLLQLVLFSGVILIAILRLIRPERLLNPSYFKNFEEFVLSLSSPISHLLPGDWLGQLILALNQKSLVSISLWLIIPYFIMTLLFLLARKFQKSFTHIWQRAQIFEKPRKNMKNRLYSKSLIRLLAKKNTLLFFRDPTALSQLGIFIIMAGIYIFNITQIAIIDSLAFMGICLFNSGFAIAIIGALAARFTYTAFSNEGLNLRLFLGAPISRKRLYLAQILISGMPPVIFAALLSFGGWLAIMGAQPQSIVPLEGIMKMRNLTILNFLSFAPATVFMAMHFGLLWLDLSEKSTEDKAMSIGGLYFVMALGGLLILSLGTQFIIPALWAKYFSGRGLGYPNFTHIILTNIPIISAGIYSLVSGLKHINRIKL